MRTLIPVLENKGIKSKVSPHFEDAPFFAIFDSDKPGLEIKEKSLKHMNPAFDLVDQLMMFEPTLAYVINMGQRAIGLFMEQGVELKTGSFKIVKDVIENIDNLEDLKHWCIY